MRFVRMITGIVFLAVSVAGVAAQQAATLLQGGAAGGGGRGPAGPRLTLTSPTVTDFQAFPMKYGCDHDAVMSNVSFPLAWANPPAATQSFAVVVLDADLRAARGVLAPSHWYIWNIPATATSLAEGVPHVAQLPDGSRQNVTAPRGGGPPIAYRSPCPTPAGATHHYSIELYALDVKLDGVAPGAALTDVMQAMDTHVIGHAIMLVTFKIP